MSDMPQARVSMPANWAAQHLSVALKYFENTDRLRPHEWRIALQTFDMLGRGTFEIGRRRQSFQQIYDRYVDRRFADDFINQLMSLEDLTAAAEKLQQKVAFDVLAMLEREGFYRENLTNSEYLAAYCLYWWTAFALGYRFELTIFRELQTSGIDFVAHDLRKRAERRSPYDLVVLRQLGDIKSTTYFLHSVRALPLKCDFYITRLYHSRRRCYVPVVVMKEQAWHLLNGEVAKVSLDTAANYLPKPVEIVFEGQRLVIAPFYLWKEKVIQRQNEEK